MPGTNAGTGQPLTLKCRVCRRRDGLSATGRTKPYRQGRGCSNIGVRQTNRLIEYSCRCGHVGWSQHMDAERLLRRAILGEIDAIPTHPEPPSERTKPATTARSTKR